MNAILTTMHDMAAALDAACNGRPKALHRLRPTVPTPDEIEAAEPAPLAKIVTDFNGLGWTACREDYDLGHPVGMSIKSEADAIADLLEAEECA